VPAIRGGRFAITGGASQVGSHVAEHLLNGGASQVLLLDNLSLGSPDLLQPLLADARCTLIRADVLRLPELIDAFDGMDGVFAVAALMATSIGRDPWTGLDVNIRGLQNTLESCRHQRVRKIVLSSSAGVYGAPEDVPTTETSPLRWQSLAAPMTLYCASKVVGEGLARLYMERYGVDYVALRYTAVYGERQHRRALVGGHIAETCERIRAGLPPLLDGDGSQVYDYVYAGDVARANLMAMESEIAGEGINVCSGVETSQRETVALVAKACGANVQPQMRESSTAARLPSAGRQVYSREKAHRLLRWEPEVSLAEGVRRVLSWVDRRESE